MDIMITVPDADAPRVEHVLLKRGGYNPAVIPEHADVTTVEFIKRTLAALLGDLIEEWERRDEAEKALDEAAKAKPRRVLINVT